MAAWSMIWFVSGLVPGLSAASPESAATATKAELAHALGAMRHDTPPAKVYAVWNDFCRTHFGAEKEPLVYELFGKETQIVPGSQWVHVSETSACIAWETTLPTTSWVEYGRTPACNSRTEPTERPFYIHVHYLKNLETDKVHYVRKVSVDERGKRVVSPLTTIVTRAAPAAVHVPGNLPGPPYVLDKPNTTYVLTKDITAKRTAIEVAAPGITLDLGGHTVTYHDETVPKEVFNDKWMSYVHKGAVGVKNFGHSGLTILNGTVREGQGYNVGNTESTGFIPIYMRDVSNIRIAGVTVDYWTPQNTGMRLRKPGGDVEVHHCVFLDRG
ncbi:MAG: hypothetical protein AMK75_04895, partial [Planctomycetes bacterium SM23_65]